MSLAVPTHFAPIFRDIHAPSDEEFENERLKHIEKAVNLYKNIFLNRPSLNLLPLPLAITTLAITTLVSFSSEYLLYTNTCINTWNVLQNSITAFGIGLTIDLAWNFIKKSVTYKQNKKYIETFSNIKNDPKKESILVLMSDEKSDWNGAFHSFYDRDMLPLSQKYNMHLFYPNSIEDINRYLKIKKFSQILLYGHGTISSIMFSPTFQLTDRNISKLDNISYRPFVVLNSCSTGNFGGIGERIAQQFHCTVSAPTCPAGIDEIKFLPDGTIKYIRENDEKTTRIICYN